MLLAAGLGTRLRPLTDHTPKPLVEVGGVPILERVARRLIAAGADRLVVNTSHLGEQVQAYVQGRNGFGVDVAFSPEPKGPLETGGGLLKARHLFRGDAPFFLHNADILTTLPLADVYAAHLARTPLATVAVMERPTSRHLLFDDLGLMGRSDARTDLDIRVRPPVGEVRKLAFAGVHVVSPAFLGRITERGAFSILDPYLRLAAKGERIVPFRADGWLWVDIGSHAQLAEARRLVEAGELD
jgi:NDP-sugar pyrophosphorylase family protein